MLHSIPFHLYLDLQHVWPDLLAMFRQSHAAMFQLTIISCGHDCCFVYNYEVIKIGL